VHQNSTKSGRQNIRREKGRLDRSCRPLHLARPRPTSSGSPGGRAPSQPRPRPASYHCDQPSGYYPTGKLAARFAKIARDAAADLLSGTERTKTHCDVAASYRRLPLLIPWFGAVMIVPTVPQGQLSVAEEDLGVMRRNLRNSAQCTLKATPADFPPLNQNSDRNRLLTEPQE